MVLVGDFFQLPPVSSSSFIEFAFEHPAWKTFRLAILLLNTQYRQSSETSRDPLLQVLSEIRSGTISSHSIDLLNSRNLPVETEDHTELFTKNKSVDSYNSERLNAIAGDIFLYEMSGKGTEKLIESLKK